MLVRPALVLTTEAVDPSAAGEVADTVEEDREDIGVLLIQTL
jgi:hypothetical protein